MQEVALSSPSPKILVRPFGTSLRALVTNFRGGLSRLLNEAFRAGSIRSQFYADTAIDGITLRFSEGAESDDGDGFTTGEDVVDPPASPMLMNCS